MLVRPTPHSSRRSGGATNECPLVRIEPHTMNAITKLDAIVPLSAETEEPPVNTASPHVQEVIRSAEKELAELLQRRDEVTRRIRSIKKMLSGLAELLGRTVLDRELLSTLESTRGKCREGFTQACRLILMESTTPLSVQQGCAELRKKFPELAQRHRHLHASVTTVFRRLASYSEVRCLLDGDGRRMWKWKGERPSLQNLPAAFR